MSLLQTVPLDIEKIIHSYRVEMEKCEARQDEAIQNWLLLDKQTSSVLEFLEEHSVTQPIQTILLELANTMREQGKMALTAELCCGQSVVWSESEGCVVVGGCAELLEYFNKSVLSEIYLAHLENNCDPPSDLQKIFERML